MRWQHARAVSCHPPGEGLMSQILNLVLIAAMIAALGVVILGVVNMARTGPAGRQRSNKLMQLRILFQFLAILLIGGLLFAWSG